MKIAVTKPQECPFRRRKKQGRRPTGRPNPDAGKCKLRPKYGSSRRCDDPVKFPETCPLVREESIWVCNEVKP